MSPLNAVIDAFAGLRVLAVGDALLDEYLVGGDTRIAREAPVPQVGVDRREAVPGGAGNLAANLAALGADVRFLSVVGDDPDGAVLTGALRDAGVGTRDVLVEPGRVTIAKRRLVAGDQLLARFDEGRPAPLAEATRARVAERLPALFGAAQVVVVSDYAYGLLDDRLVAALADLQRGDPRVLVVDARTVARFRAVRPTAVKPNYDEVCRILDAEPGARGDRAAGDRAAGDRAAAVAAAGERLHAATGAQVVAVTLDRDGSVVCARGRPPYRTWARPVPHRRACGAGDSFTAALALALGAGGGTAAAAELAQAAATVVTGRDGTSVCSARDLRAHLASTSTQLVTLDDLAEQVAFHRRQGRRVVFTNGCFDLLHHGHVDLLNRAKALGDVLVVGVNSDAGIRQVHGPDRPLNPLAERARVLAALSAVDHLVAFDEATAVELVTRLRPDVYVKGGDYLRSMLPEVPHVEAYGGTVRILPYLEDRSTVELIARIRGAAGGGPAS
jgi:D-beta-D-heptose 7-phosphate kinase/D-beta-D-heptose 1-phosphate adenosyltransferase